MIKQTKSFLLKASFLSISLTTTCLAFTPNESITLSQVTKDVTYLASDELNGRGNFSSDIKKAADYIAMRFKENSLVSAKKISTQSFLQTYQVAKTTPTKLSLYLNNHEITADNLAMATSRATINWTFGSTNHKQNTNIDNAFEIINISATDNMREVLSSLNQQGGNYLVLINPAHTGIFKRYQEYFQKGLTKLAQDDAHSTSQGAIVMALTNTSIENIHTVQFSGKSESSTYELTNVVGVLPGKTKPEEIVLYSAHYDHLGVKNNQGDQIYNGADDNASGTTAIINIAQYYAQKNDNARTLMFAAFSAEEIGGFGSRYFSQQLDPQSIVAMINIEMIGKPSKFGAGSVWMTGMERSTLGEQLNAELTKSTTKIYQDPYPEQGLFYRSDNATLARLGVPAHSFSSTQLDKDQHYHQASDDINSLDLPSLFQVIKTLAIATQPLVDASVTPSRIDENKVKAKGLIF